MTSRPEGSFIFIFIIFILYEAYVNRAYFSRVYLLKGISVRICIKDMALGEDGARKE